MRKFGFKLILFLFVLFTAVTKALASGEFTADYEVDYVISPQGKTIVTKNVTLTNQLTNLYPKQYSIILDSVNINNILAYDEGGYITPKVSRHDGKTEVLLTFNRQVVGLGKKLKFTLRYENNDIASKNGAIWEVNIPGINADPDIVSFNLTLDVPASFGRNAYLMPIPAKKNTWTKEQLIHGGVMAAYGEKQYFHTVLTYYLENSQLNPLEKQITLPPDTSYQQTTIKSINPAPDSISKDKDGNWLAKYQLLPKQALTITADLYLEIFLKPRPDYSLSEFEQNLYLQRQDFWEVDNPKIIGLAKQNKTPAKIYQYVVNTLNYDYQRATSSPVRKGASAALESPNNAVCMEFTDLFIAIARAAGIPAREAIGYAHTNNQKLRPLSLTADVLHTWPEYYDFNRNLWVPVDPTWAKTTGGLNYFDLMDFNHIVFAYHGLSSRFPEPAGFYRNNQKNNKNLLINFVDKIDLSSEQSFDISFNYPKVIWSGGKFKGTFIIKNASAKSLDSLNISIQSQELNFNSQKRESNLPPLAKLEIPVEVQIPLSLNNSKAVFSIFVNNETRFFSLEIRSVIWLGVIFALIIFSVALISYFIYKRWKRSHQKA